MQKRPELYEPWLTVIIFGILYKPGTYCKLCYTHSVVRTISLLDTLNIPIIFSPELNLICYISFYSTLEVCQYLRYHEQAKTPFSEFTASTLKFKVTALTAIFRKQPVHLIIDYQNSQSLCLRPLDAEYALDSPPYKFIKLS